MRSIVTSIYDEPRCIWKVIFAQHKIYYLMGVQLNGLKANGKTIVLNWNFTDVGEK